MALKIHLFSTRVDQMTPIVYDKNIFIQLQGTGQCNKYYI